MTTRRTDERADFLASVLTTAVEGGIQYWATVDRYRWGYRDLGQSDGTPLPAEVQPYASAVIRDLDEDIEVLATADTIAKGLGVLRRGPVKYVSVTNQARLLQADRENDAGEIDAGDADVILQLGIFGEVIYG